MHEIGVRVLAKTIKHRVIHANLKAVPAHMRDWQAGSRLDRLDHAVNPTETGGLTVFQAEIGEQLHADTDTEKRLSPVMHGVFHRLDHAGARFQLALALGEMADTRQDDPVRP